MKYPKLLSEHIKLTINSFEDHGYSEDARNLNKSLQNLNWNKEPEELIDFGEPMYFNGDINAPTVLIALNPGSGSEKKWIPKDFKSYIEYYSNLGSIKQESKFDNFDGKQAAFLSSFKNSGIQIPDRFWEKSNDIKKQATTAVLNQKLQLEFLPYPSRKIKFISSNPKIKKLSNILLPHFERLLDTIIFSERKYVVFTSRLFENLLKLSQKEGLIDSLDFSREHKKTGVVNFSLSAKAVTFNYKGKTINSVIANSFGSQALPNAFSKMSSYGKFCYELHP